MGHITRKGAGIAVAMVLVCILWASETLSFAASQDQPPPSSDPSVSPMRGLIQRYQADLEILRRFEDAPLSERRLERERSSFDEWLAALNAVDFAALDLDGRVDFVLFRNQLQFEQRAIGHEQDNRVEMTALLPFAETITILHEAQRDLVAIIPEDAATTLTGLHKQLSALRQTLEKELDQTKDAPTDRPPHLKVTIAFRASRTVVDLQRSLREWFEFHNEYDPLFSWWVRDPWMKVDLALAEYAKFLRERIVGITAANPDAIIGDPIGREALLDMLEYEMIAYTPEELLEIAESEYAWCLEEMLKASRDMEFGDDWKAALEHVKTLHVAPGEQPALIRDLALEAIAFLEERDLVSIPELCKQSWRMEMMSPARQKVSPFFLGGETILVSFPTSTMEHGDKMMSLRANNIHFSRATVQHELIPGHHLQGFMMDRYRTHREIFNTPFWLEGWALYWEMRLWDLEFPRTPENRIGMLFWRMHRCARIVFSLSFHLGEMTPQQAIDYLVERVGHERNTAEAEVRRSVSGDYGPLYQAAYMLGGLQFRALHEELVQSGQLTEREFHDTILQNNSIPVEMVRAILMNQPPEEDFEAAWKFYRE